ncbi:hypothetical protein [Bradyrhizobium australiense]|uniref:Uncharacterized protein n=1 Tax=Bradyrhizobium australiense TaxID=2721161 RepID=A0A7Y4GZ25_9BRAD|nr:hypothetical protein [Bradyrhizobium australiense]NOJ44630.1 hypothetical protein [Bradyrhizobium australiense]
MFESETTVCARLMKFTANFRFVKIAPNARHFQNPEAASCSPDGVDLRSDDVA